MGEEGGVEGVHGEDKYSTGKRSGRDGLFRQFWILSHSVYHFIIQQQEEEINLKLIYKMWGSKAQFKPVSLEKSAIQQNQLFF